MMLIRIAVRSPLMLIFAFAMAFILGRSDGNHFCHLYRCSG